MCDWPKYVTCECPELSVPRGLTVNAEEEKEDIHLEREVERWGRALLLGAQLFSARWA